MSSNKIKAFNRNIMLFKKSEVFFIVGPIVAKLENLSNEWFNPKEFSSTWRQSLITRYTLVSNSLNLFLFIYLFCLLCLKMSATRRKIIFNHECFLGVSVCVRVQIPEEISLEFCSSGKIFVVKEVIKFWAP